ncbi:MAG: hypothetical protein ACJ78Q_09420 [Chloroflexia bacterium]
MNDKATGEQTIQALLRVGDVLNATYGKNRERFTLDTDDRARLDYTLRHFVDFVRVSPPDPTNTKAIEHVRFHLAWLWGILLYQANPIRSVIGDAEMNILLTDLAWVQNFAHEGSAAEDAMLNSQPVVRCGRCDRAIPGRFYSLCAQCQVDGYRVCAYCGQGAASTSNPYCDQCAEVIVGGG